MLPEHNKVNTQRDRISLEFIMKLKTSKITPKGKFTAKVKIYEIYHIFVTYHHGRILTANCCAQWLIFYCPRAQWAALREQICAVAPVISRLAF